MRLPLNLLTYHSTIEGENKTQNTYRQKLLTLLVTDCRTDWTWLSLKQLATGKVTNTKHK